MVQSSKKKAISVGSVLTYSLKVDGPSNLKSLHVETLVADTIEADTITPTTPLFPTTSFPVGALSLLPVGIPGHMLLCNTVTLTGSATPGATPVPIAWTGLWSTGSTNLGTTGSFLSLGPVLDQADYTTLRLGIAVSGNVTTSATAATRNVVLQISDRTTNTFVANCNFPMRCAASTQNNIFYVGTTAFLTPAFLEQDPDREWNIRFTAPLLAAGETIVFETPVVHVFLINAVLA